MDPADRLFLDEARRRGALEVVLVREGREDPEAAVVHAQFKSMCEAGLLKRAAQYGSRARMQGAELKVRYDPTPVALQLLEAEEAREQAQRLVDQARAVLDRRDDPAAAVQALRTLLKPEKSSILSRHSRRQL